jgi:hypothetical protein
MNQLQINLDWEREFIKDFIYLHETDQQLNEDIRKELNKKHPAQIIVIDTDKILEKHNEPHTLPF